VGTAESELPVAAAGAVKLPGLCRRYSNVQYVRNEQTLSRTKLFPPAGMRNNVKNCSEQLAEDRHCPRHLQIR
jgi:hypothetical protein